MSVRNAVTGARSNGAPLRAGYVYRGTLRDDPVRRRNPGPRAGSLPGRVLAALASLGGEASTTEVRRALEEAGTAPPRQVHVGTALNRLASMTPPRVARLGDGLGGQGRAQRWRLTAAARQTAREAA